MLAVDLLSLDLEVLLEGRIHLVFIIGVLVDSSLPGCVFYKHLLRVGGIEFVNQLLTALSK